MIQFDIQLNGTVQPRHIYNQFINYIGFLASHLT